MQKIIYAFVGMNHSFSLPFNFGDNHLDAFKGYLSEFEHHNDVKLSKKEKMELKKDVAYGYITYDATTNKYDVVNKVEAVSIADKAGQLMAMFNRKKPLILEYDMFNLGTHSITNIGDILRFRMNAWR